MTLLFVMNIGFAWGVPVGFNPAWAVNSNNTVGAVAPQPVTH